MTNNTDPAGLSSSPRYRVVADRDKGDDPQWTDIVDGDRVLYISGSKMAMARIDRIERPVPTTSCGSQGPRIGGEGRPVCEQPIGHAGTHRGGDDTGFENVTWNDSRPVPTTDHADRSPIDAWNAMDTSAIGSPREAFLAGAAWAHPSVPTREQIADEVTGIVIGSGYYSTSIHRDEALEVADAVLALIQKGTDR